LADGGRGRETQHKISRMGSEALHSASDCERIVSWGAYISYRGRLDVRPHTFHHPLPQRADRNVELAIARVLVECRFTAKLATTFATDNGWHSACKSISEI
jgi:hypothetical protein